MLHRLALNLASLLRCSVTWHTCQLYLSNNQTTTSDIVEDTICSKQTAVCFCVISSSEATCCPPSLWCLQCCWRAFCRMQNVLGLSTASCHAVTSYGVTICGSTFPPTVSKHCQHQHSAIPKNRTSNVKYQQSQLLWFPRCCFLHPASQQPLFMATAVSSLMSLQACQNKTTVISKI